MKNTANNTTYTVQELHIFHNHLEMNYELFYLSTTPLDVTLPYQYFHYILQLIYQRNFFFTYSFYNLNALVHYMIYHIDIYNYLDFK